MMNQNPEQTDMEWLQVHLGLLDIHTDEAGVVGFGFNSITGDATLYGSLQDAVNEARKHTK